MPASASLSENVNRLDDLRREERCIQDQIAEILSQHLFGQSYDRIDRQARMQIEGVALRAIRSIQPAWKAAAWQRAVRGLDDAMAGHMGRQFALQSEERRLVLAAIGTRAVLSGLLSVLEVSDPFDGPGEALRIYRAASDPRQPRSPLGA